VDTSLREPFLEQISVIYAKVKAVLDERQRRLVLGAAAVGPGWDQEGLRRQRIVGER